MKMNNKLQFDKLLRTSFKDNIVVLISNYYLYTRDIVQSGKKRQRRHGDN